MKSIHSKKQEYKKLKEYTYEKYNEIFTIFGFLWKDICIYNYTDSEGNVKEYNCRGSFDESMKFLYEHYVVGISARYYISDDKIIPYLYITLREKYFKN